MKTLAFIPAVLLLLATSFAQADGARLSSQRFDVSIRDQDVREVLEELSAATGVPIKASEAVTGVVNASFERATAEDLLDRIAKQRGLDWRYDGRRVEVTSKSEQITRILRMRGIRLDELNRSLEALEVYDPQFSVTAVDGGIAMVVGPPSYLALVEVVLDELVRAAREAEDERRRTAESYALEQRRLDDHRRRALEQEYWMREHLKSRSGPAIVRNGVWGG